MKGLKLHLSMHYKHAHSTNSYTQLPTDSALMLAYEHIVTQNKNNRNKIYLNVAMKTIVVTIGNITYNFVIIIIIIIKCFI